MSVTTAKINPAIAKDLKNGSVLCLICNTQVKAKTWIAHSSGRKHHDNIEVLKKKHLQSKSQKGSLNNLPDGKQITSSFIHTKRDAATDHPEIPAHKKRKVFEQHISAEKEHAEELASTSYYSSADDESSVNGAPWQSAEAASSNEIGRKSSSKRVIAGVPEGFFDDEKLDSRVVETMKKQARMEEEYALFMNELKDAEKEQEEEDDVEEEAFSLERDVSNINEHINGWKTLNKLEIHREEVVASATQLISDQSKVGEMSEDSDSDTELIGLISWRNKPFL